SSSARPVNIRGCFSNCTSIIRVSAACWLAPLYPEKRELRDEVCDAITSSVNVFHAPQSIHCPAHLGACAPQTLQAYTDFTFGMIPSSFNRVFPQVPLRFTRATFKLRLSEPGSNEPKWLVNLRD